MYLEFSNVLFNLDLGIRLMNLLRDYLGLKGALFYDYILQRDSRAHYKS